MWIKVLQLAALGVVLFLTAMTLLGCWREPK
jgi:hypothetical protein